MHNGLASLGTTLEITQIDAAEFQTDLNALGDADSAFNAARSTRKTASEAYIIATDNIYSWLQRARGVLVTKLGLPWSTIWTQAGFINGSTAIPRTVDQRYALALTLANFLTANPGYEVAALEVTAAKATLLRTAANTARTALTNADMLQNDKRATRDSAFKTLVSDIALVISILKKLLSPDDARWMAFGLNMPATDVTPGKPLNLAAELDASGNIMVHCEAVPLATRYRWRMLLVGVQTEYQLAARSTDPMAVITDVLPGQTVKLIVQAVNGSLQGVASDPIQFTIPLPAASRATTTMAEPAAATPAPTLEEVSVSGNGNGSSANGHENGQRVPARA